MPSIAQDPFSASSGQKRRRDDHPSSMEVQKKVPSPHHHYHNHISEPATFLNTEIHNNIAYNRKLLIPRPHRHDLKRQRVETSSIAAVGNPFFACPLPSPDSEHELVNQGHDSSNTMILERKTKVDLSPCHICRRKPTVKSELDAFADCEECMERTCYICIRECLGSDTEVRREMAEGQKSDSPLNSFHGSEDGMDQGGGGRFRPYHAARFGCDIEEERAWRKPKPFVHKRMICSRCCVERGTEGEVWCLGCLGADGPD